MNKHRIALELDAETTGSVQHLAETWGVSAEEVVRRAVKSADATVAPSSRMTRLEAFKELQRLLQITPEKAAAWQGVVRDARR